MTDPANRVTDGPACRGCGLPNYEGFCPHCRGDQDAYEYELVPPFETSLSGAEICDHAGHEWAPAGGGLEICMVCEDERWVEDDAEEPF